jgi:hypothetical protein
MPNKTRLARFTCHRCAKVWTAAAAPLPVYCPRCGRADWQQSRVRKPKRRPSLKSAFLEDDFE